ncbi:TPA: hypothetical protein CPT94_08250 [Candidatus Gastranaerophilales bacterium HUM_22]|nr:MAG TPA: hypothetical protein CPT94_08250 [Candidatus Gastranaerophilales bacterium HUM_22]
MVVVPFPDTALFNVPPERFKLPELATVPLILSALLLMVPELVIAPFAEPRAALLVKVTPLLTFTP